MSKRLEMLLKMRELKKDDPFVHYGLALEFKSLGRLDEALATFASMREQFASYVPQYLMASQILTAQARNDEARVVLTVGIEAARKARDLHAAGELESALAALP